MAEDPLMSNKILLSSIYVIIEICMVKMYIKKYKYFGWSHNYLVLEKPNNAFSCF